jgi:chromosome segregation protein
LKGIIILGFKKGFKPFIDTQFPSNICEFLGVTPKILQILSDEHMKRKMEPNFLNMQIKEDVNVASFYTGFTFRHYVGKPDFAITVFISDDDIISDNFEGMIRRIAHELLPKREALNFDDILGQYYEMLKNEELSSYWEEIIEGESTMLEGKQNELVEQENSEEKEEKGITESKDESETPDIEQATELETLKAKNIELQGLVEEKSGKIRDLSQKYTEIASEKNNFQEEIEALKNEISEQYIKLEKWSQQMADLNENNAKLMEEIRSKSEQLSNKDKLLEEKEKEIEDLKKSLTGAEDIEKEAENLLQKLEDLKNINLGLNSEIEKLETKNKQLLYEIDKIKDESNLHIDSLTNLKLEVKELKAKLNSKDEEKDKVKDEILDLKKEIKVLRRERDHYKKLVKEHNLL